VVKTFGVCDFSRLAVTDWRLRRWRLWFLALVTSTQRFKLCILGEIKAGRTRRWIEYQLHSTKAWVCRIRADVDIPHQPCSQ